MKILLPKRKDVIQVSMLKEAGSIPAPATQGGNMRKDEIMGKLERALRKHFEPESYEIIASDAVADARNDVEQSRGHLLDHLHACFSEFETGIPEEITDAVENAYSLILDELDVDEEYSPLPDEKQSLGNIGI